MDEPLEDLPLFSYQTTGSVSESEATAPLKSDSSLSAAINAWGEALEAQGRSIHTGLRHSQEICAWLGSSLALVSPSTR